MKNWISVCRAICLLCLIGVFVPSVAQNNPYKIDDSLYEIYQRATRYRASELGLRIADTLYAEALKKNDKKAQCLALTIPVIYANRNSTNFSDLEAATSRLKEVSRVNNYLQYYYFAYTYEVNFLLNSDRSLAALQRAEEMKEQAFKDQHAYGIFSCIRIIGNIYWARRNMDMALQYYKNALAYMLESLPDQDPAPLYLKIAAYYRHYDNFQETLPYIEKAIKEAKTDETRGTAMLEKCQTLYSMGLDAEFLKYYDECTQMAKRLGPLQVGTLRVLGIYKLILEGEYEKADKQIDSIEQKSTQLMMWENLYWKKGDFKMAHNFLQQRFHYRDSLDNQLSSNDLAELNAQIGNERMKIDMQALALNNAELNAQNANMELEQTRSQMELERVNAENNKLMLNNKELELNRIKLDAERQQAIAKEQQIASRHHIVTLSLVISFLLLLSGFLVFYLYKRRRSMAHLKQKNEELLVARDRAEQADHMKTFFIQNMSHEIRTPLNAIVGFSQLLFDSDMPLSEEDKREFSNLIQQNSELLTTLINDILDLANLESGKYTMNLEPHHCNELCRMAISTVAHRNPKSVKLYFTSEVNDDYQIVTDANRLRQVLINFLTNAEKYTEQGEIHLHCSLSENPGKITFSVTDTGTGIPADKAETVFERFKKLDEFKQGTGLGLNICRIIAERLKGEVKLDRNYTSGARFLFILPL